MSETPKPPSPEADDLLRLRELLLGDRIVYVDALYRRVKDPEQRTEDVAEVLPGAMETVVADPVAQPKFAKPLVETIRGAIKRDTESFAEALFPVLGPAIRRAVADALKSLVERINVAIEHSFTIKGLSWRLEAARSGVPFAQIVLRETMIYAVQEVFLIQPESGLVLAKARRADTLALDEDAFSAMLTAIQAFVKDSLGASEGDTLRGAELGDRALWVVNGPQAVLACLVIGSPPLELREDLMNGLETIHAHHGDELQGSPEQLAGRPDIEVLLEEMLLGEVAEAKKQSGARRAVLMWGAAAVLLLALLGWGAWNTWQVHQEEAAIAALFEAEPGYVLTEHDANGAALRFSGLRDPLARAPEAVLSETGRDVDGVQLSFRSFQSLDQEIVLQRLRRSLGGDGIDLQLDGDVLVVTGQVTAARRATLLSLPGLNPAVASVDLSGTRLDGDAAADLARRELNAPASVSITPMQGGLVVSGSDPAWYAATSVNTGPFGGWAVDYAPMREGLVQRLAELRAEVDGRELKFTESVTLVDETSEHLAEVANVLTELVPLAEALGEAVAVRLVGHSDGLGGEEANQALALRRAEVVREALIQLGIDAGSLTAAAAPWQPGRADPSLRKVLLELSEGTKP
jgi:OOP family OmpA-OmpF porin